MVTVYISDDAALRSICRLFPSDQIAVIGRSSPRLQRLETYNTIKSSSSFLTLAPSQRGLKILQFCSRIPVHCVMVSWSTSQTFTVWATVAVQPQILGDSFLESRIMKIKSMWCMIFALFRILYSSVAHSKKRQISRFFDPSRCFSHSCFENATNGVNCQQVYT